MRKDKERMEEHWVVCVEFPKYSVSNYGNVRNNRTGRDLKLTVGKDGRIRLWLSVEDGFKQSVLVHHLVAQAFFENYKGDMQIKHLNGVLHDNSVINLSLGTRRKRLPDYLKLW